MQIDKSKNSKTISISITTLDSLLFSGFYLKNETNEKKLIEKSRKKGRLLREKMTNLRSSKNISNHNHFQRIIYLEQNHFLIIQIRYR